MSEKLTVDLNEFKRHLDYFKEINKTDLSEIILKIDNDKFLIKKDAIEDFRFMGLINRDFFQMELYIDALEKI